MNLSEARFGLQIFSFEKLDYTFQEHISGILILKISWDFRIKNNARYWTHFVFQMSRSRLRQLKRFVEVTLELNGQWRVSFSRSRS